MVLLPKGNPVKENANPGKINLPGALEKLQAGKFSGYLRFDFPTATGVIIFEQGRLISSLLDDGRERLIAYDAIAAIFEQSLEGQGRLDVYRLSPELALSVHALLHGDLLYKGQELKLIDIKLLLARLKELAITGCLRIYTGDRVALIFYREGNPLGFFHDGSTAIETTADTSMSVARLPGAKIDVLTTKGVGEGMLADLLSSADLPALWKRILEARRPAPEPVAFPAPSVEEPEAVDPAVREAESRDELLAAWREIAVRHLGKIGGSLVEKEFEKNLSDVLDTATLNVFYERLGKAARLVAGHGKVNGMVEEMGRAAQEKL